MLNVSLHSRVYGNGGGFIMIGRRLFAFFALFSLGFSGITHGGVLNTPQKAQAASLQIEDEGEYVQVGDFEVKSRLLELLFDVDEQANAKEDEKLLIPWGGIFGARIKCAHPTVRHAAQGCSLQNGDEILKVNGIKIKSIEEIKQSLSCTDGGAVSFTVLRGEETVEIKVTPKLTEEGFELPFELQEGTAGIGTVTYIDPETLTFGGLGHGICDPDTGEVVRMKGGAVTGVILGGVQKGERGKPGELCGILTEKNLGELYANTDCGVFGRLSVIPKRRIAPIPVGKADEVTVGEAKIISTIKNGMTEEYSIKITAVNRDAEGSKCFKIKITDPTLLALTGGVVRGMSGSPIIQNGKLVGAVTHVLINDPTTGYGIFIENMLNAAQMPMAKAS